MACRLDFDALPSNPTAAPVGVAPVGWIPPDPATKASSGRRFSRRSIIGTVVAVIVGLAVIGSVQPTEPGSPVSDLATATPAVSTPLAVSKTVAPTSTPEPTFGPIHQTTEAKVVRVVDGDTIVVAFGGKEYKVRYIGMDSPETVDPNSPVQWMGSQATAANVALVDGATVFLEKDVSEVDRFDRLLRYVWLADGAAWTLVNLELVRQGVASAKSYPPDTAYDELYQAAEGEAQSVAVGLWGPPPAPAIAKATPKPTPRPTAKPTAKPKPASNCHPSYDPCLPIVDDLNCPDVRDMGLAPVTVIGPDDYGLDRDNDGFGCD
jgi:micrococcal nuclease